MPVSSIPSHPAPYAPPEDRTGAIPPLENGDRLTREEFERRYDAMPDLKKAELIEGRVYVSSPVRQRQHGGPHSRLSGWLFTYEARTPGLELGDNSTVRLDVANEPQPDCLLFIQPEHGGQVVIDDEGYINGARTSSRKSPPAAPATTSTTSSGSTRRRAFANTSCGACSTGRSTGMSSAGPGTSC